MDAVGEEGKGDLGRKPGRSNDTSRFFFFFFKPLLLWAHLHDTFGAVFESYDQILILWPFYDIPNSSLNIETQSWGKHYIMDMKQMTRN